MPNPTAHKKKARRLERRQQAEAYTPEALEAAMNRAAWEYDERERDAERREARRFKGVQRT